MSRQLSSGQKWQGQVCTVHSGPDYLLVSGDASVGDFTSRWGFKGSHEVSEGLTASYKYEAKINTTNAESSGGAGHGHDQQIADSGGEFTANENADDSTMNDNECNVGWPYTISDDGEYEAVDAMTLTGDSPQSQRA